MRMFSCPSCGAVLYFTNLSCEQCGIDVVFDPPADAFAPLLRGCANRQTAERCNWSCPQEWTWCASCVLDRDHRASELRLPFQDAKRRTVRQLGRFGIDPQRAAPPVSFLLQESTPGNPVTIGHADGTITLDVAEGDPAHLADVRTDLGEPYRTPLGHVRHELGHWYWQAFGDVSFSLTDFRQQFGDERADYQAALAAHYDAVDDGSWTGEFISFYATAHPWEDFAESFAHYLHITDTLETAAAHELADTDGPLGDGDIDFATRYDRWVRLATALNDLDRSMGVPDAYPFVAGPAAVDKIHFVAEAIERSRSV